MYFFNGNKFKQYNSLFPLFIYFAYINLVGIKGMQENALVLFSWGLLYFI